MAVSSRALDDHRAISIPWRKVLIAAVGAVVVFAAWLMTTNTYAVVWQQRMEDRWAGILATGHLAARPADGQPVARLSIPDLGLSRVILEGVDRATLRKGPGHLPGSVLPGELGNSVVQAHRILWSAPFAKISELSFGSPVLVQSADGAVRRFLVAGIFHMDLDDPEIATSTPGQTTITLVTSDPPFRASDALVVRAVLPTTTAPTPPEAAP